MRRLAVEAMGFIMILKVRSFGFFAMEWMAFGRLFMKMRYFTLKTAINEYRTLNNACFNPSYVYSRLEILPGVQAEKIVFLGFRVQSPG